MADIKEDAITKERQRLIGKYFDDFTKHVAGEDLTSVLLKGHLLIELYLDHVMVLMFDKKANIKNKSFYEKVYELKETHCFQDHKTAVSCLLALNEVRRDLAHQINFQLTLTQIDAVGLFLGKEYIARRYSSESDDRKLLLWVLEQIAYMVYYPIVLQTVPGEQNKMVDSNGKTSSQELSSGTIQVNGGR